MQLEIDFQQVGIFLLEGVLFIIAFIFVVVLFRKIYRHLRKPELIGYSLKNIQLRWEEVEKLIEQKTEMSYKLAIIEADKLLDHVLKALGFPGEDMGQRLHAACYKHEKLRRVWFAHKMRNQLVHESSFHLTYWQAKDATKAYRTAMRDLNVL